MARITIGVGSLLIILGLVGYFVLAEPDEAGAKSITAMIPAFFGVPILLLGFVATKAALRKHAMHGAVLLGFVMESPARRSRAASGRSGRGRARAGPPARPLSPT